MGNYSACSGFRCKVDKKCTLLGYYAACAGTLPLHAVK